MNVSDYLLETGASADPAVITGERTHSYGDLRRATARCASHLADRGLPPGSRVALQGPNSFFWVAAYLAIMRSGHVAVPIPDRMRVDDARRAGGRLGLMAAFVDRRSLRGHTAAFPEAPPPITDEVLTADGPPPERAGPRRGPTGPDTGAGTDAALMLTSGTTAGPKAVRVTHANLRANTESIIAALGLGRRDRILVVLPFHYCFGASLLHTHLRVGASMVLCESFAYPETAVEAIERHGCTEFAGVPSSYQMLLRASSFAGRDLPTLRLLQAAGGRLPEAVVQEIRRAGPEVDLCLMYGQTEATARLSYLPPSRLADKPGSIGRGIPGVELRVLDEHGEPVAPGRRGEIYARGANISPGYVDDPEASAAKFTEHGLRTGDLATVDEDGDIYVVDRREDFIKSWGYRISSQSIEGCALGLPEVVHAAAVGVPDTQAGEAVTLFVVRRPDSSLTADEVLATCRARLARHEVPRSVVFVDSMPLNPSGKVVKARLREMAATA